MGSSFVRKSRFDSSRKKNLINFAYRNTVSGNCNFLNIQNIREIHLEEKIRIPSSLFFKERTNMMDMSKVNIEIINFSTRKEIYERD